MANGDCVVGARHEAEIEELQRIAGQNAKDHDEMWKAINSLRNRLPVWATAAISLLTFLCGILGTLAKMK